jgi:hypothetical protein
VLGSWAPIPGQHAKDLNGHQRPVIGLVTFGPNGKMQGTSGCGSFSGPFSTGPKHRIDIPDPAEQAIACADKDFHVIPSGALTALLPTAKTWSLVGDRLSLRDQHGGTVVVLDRSTKPTPLPPSTAAS